MIASVVAADLWFENVMLSIRSPYFLHLASLVTFFGNTTTVIAIAGIIGAFLLYTRPLRSFFAGLIITLAGAAASASLIKELVGRARPGGLIQAVAETSYSFPSGHATASLALYGFIAFMLGRVYPQYRKIFVLVAALSILSIGFSRLYLGVHFPSDVLAGYLVGGLWLFVGIAITNRQRASNRNG